MGCSRFLCTLSSPPAELPSISISSSLVSVPSPCLLAFIFLPFLSLLTLELVIRFRLLLLMLVVVLPWVLGLHKAGCSACNEKDRFVTLISKLSRS